MEVVEETVVHALEEEVKVMFPHHQEHSPEGQYHEQQVTHNQLHRQHVLPVQVQQQHHDNEARPLHIRFEKEGQIFPYDLQGSLDKEKQEHNIAHAVQVAEKAFVRAIEQEVDTFFPQLHPLGKQPSSKAIRAARKTPKSIVHNNHKKHKAHDGVEQHDYHSLEEFLELIE